MLRATTSYSDLSNLSAVVFDGDNTGATDVTASLIAHHNTYGMVVLPAGQFLIGDVETDTVPKFSALIPGTATLIVKSGSRGIYFNPPVTEVIGTAVSVSAIAAQQTAGYDDVLDRITVSALPSGIDNEMYIHITSNDSIPSAADKWAGETNKVAYFDSVNNYIYTTHPVAYRTLYTTSPLLSLFTMTHTGGYVRGLRFTVQGDYTDPSIVTRQSSIDIAGAPEFVIEGNIFDETWAQAWTLRTCPGSIVYNNTTRHLPNLAVYDSTATARVVTSATAANPGVFTFNSHGYQNGDVLYVRNATGGWAVLNGQTYLVANRATNTFQLTSLNGVPVNTTGFGTYNADLEVSEADVRGFGYSGNLYGPSAFSRIDGNYSTEGRHDANVDGRGATYSTTTNRHLQGQPTYIEATSSTAQAPIGPPNGSHEEGDTFIRRNTLTMAPYRGAQGGSYQSMHNNERCKHSLSLYCTHLFGGLGIRVVAIDHEEVPTHRYLNQYFQDIKQLGTDGSSILIQSMASLTNKPVVAAYDWYSTGVERPYQFEASSKFRGYGTHIVDGPDTRTIWVRGANCEIDFDKLVIDFRTTTTGSNCYPIFVDDDGTNPYAGNVVSIDHLHMILGDGATKPNSLLDLSGTISGSALTLRIGKISIFNPSAIALPELCSSGDYAGLTLTPNGMDFITLDLAAPQTALTTAMKAFHVIERPFIPALYIANVSTVSSSGAVTFDVNKNGTSVFGANKLSIDQSETSSKTAATAATIATSSLTPFVAGDIISVDVDGAGTSTQGGQVRIYGWFV